MSHGYRKSEIDTLLICSNDVSAPDERAAGLRTRPNEAFIVKLVLSERAFCPSLLHSVSYKFARQ
jgi:hypothetical protein